MTLVSNNLRIIATIIAFAFSLNANADMPETTINKARRDLSGESFLSFTSKKGFTPSIIEGGKENIPVEKFGYQDCGGMMNRVFVVGEAANGIQAYTFGCGGFLRSSHKDLLERACDRAKAANWKNCMLYAKDNEIVFDSSDAMLDKAESLFKQGKLKEANEIFEGVESRGLSFILNQSKGKFYYLKGQKDVRNGEVTSAINNFETSWSIYGYLDSAISALDLLSVQDISLNWKKIRETYDFIEAYSRVKNKNNSLALEKHSSLYSSTDIFIKAEQAHQINEEKNVKEQEILQQKLSDKDSKEKAEKSEKDLKVRALAEEKEAKRLAVQNNIERIKAEKEAKRLSELQRQEELKAEKEARRFAEQQRLDNIKAEKYALAEEKRRLAEYEKKSKLGDGSPDDLTCKSFGAKPSTEPYIQCRLKLAERVQLTCSLFAVPIKS